LFYLWYSLHWCTSWQNYWTCFLYFSFFVTIFLTKSMLILGWLTKNYLLISIQNWMLVYLVLSGWFKLIYKIRLILKFLHWWYNSFFGIRNVIVIIASFTRYLVHVTTYYNPLIYFFNMSSLIIDSLYIISLISLRVCNIIVK